MKIQEYKYTMCIFYVSPNPRFLQKYIFFLRKKDLLRICFFEIFIGNSRQYKDHKICDNMT